MRLSTTRLMIRVIRYAITVKASNCKPYWRANPYQLTTDLSLSENCSPRVGRASKETKRAQQSSSQGSQIERQAGTPAEKDASKECSQILIEAFSNDCRPQLAGDGWEDDIISGDLASLPGARLAQPQQASMPLRKDAKPPMTMPKAQSRYTILLVSFLNALGGIFERPCFLSCFGWHN